MTGANRGREGAPCTASSSLRTAAVVSCLFPIGLLSATSTCAEDKPCVDGVSTGDLIKMVVVERLDVSSQYYTDRGLLSGEVDTCNETIGLVAGTVLTATVRSERRDVDVCYGYLVDLEVPKFALSFNPQRGGDVVEFSGAYDAVYEESCRGVVTFGLDVHPENVENPFPSVPVPGQRLPLSVTFRFQVSPGQATCPTWERGTTCGTVLVVKAEKVP